MFYVCVCLCVYIIEMDKLENKVQFLHVAVHLLQKVSQETALFQKCLNFCVKFSAIILRRNRLVNV